jgi:hypothetical protein
MVSSIVRCSIKYVSLVLLNIFLGLWLLPNYINFFIYIVRCKVGTKYPVLLLFEKWTRLRYIY